MEQNGTQKQSKMLPDHRLNACTDRSSSRPDLPVPVPENPRLKSFGPKRER